MKRIISIITLLSFIFAAFAPVVCADTALTYEYDANGNLIRGDGKYYEYNDANKLVKVRHGDASGVVVAEYFYDHTGQRLKKIENGVTTYYIGKHYETQTDGTTSTNTSYYFANGERVAKKDSSGNMYYYHSDHLGGTNVLTNSSGSLVERTKYYPFGEVREGGSEKYLYTGKEKDNLTDWYYYEARFYNSEFKHFTQADTIDFEEMDLYDPQDLNRYAYANNNPVLYIDPSGHTSITFREALWMSAKESWVVIDPMIDMGLSIFVKPSIKGVVKGGVEASLGFVKFSGMKKDVPTNVYELPGYAASKSKKYNRYSQFLLTTGKIIDLASAHKDWAKSHRSYFKAREFKKLLIYGKKSLDLGGKAFKYHKEYFSRYEKD